MVLIMGFRAKRAWELVLPEQTHAGMVVLVRGRSVGEYLQGRDLSWEDDPKITRDEKVERYRALYKEFAADVIEWNLEDEHGTALDVSEQSLLDSDDMLLLPVVAAWANRRVKLPDPLPEPSTYGGSPQVENIPMEAPSESQAS
ncbi:MAG TPA: hypothetical protein VEO01_40565 [Pseudonocardiaceae bacterium]|nr:hypothetical protein [Pseudonocardiaceae bacterium]